MNESGLTVMDERVPCETRPEAIAIGDHVVVETTVRGLELALAGVVLNVRDRELWLGLPDPEPVVAQFRARQPLRLIAAADGGALLGQSAFVRRLAGDPPRIFSVDRPTELVEVQRRVHHRFDLDAPVRFRRLDPITKEARGRAAAGSTVNVSLGGMMLRTAAHVAVGDEVETSLPLGGLDHLTATGRVLRVRAIPTPTVPGQPFVLEVGTRFTRITSADQDLLVRMAVAADRRRRLAAEALGQFDRAALA